MLAGKRQIKLSGVEVAKSPILIPSFSSKGFSKDVKGLLGMMSEFITESQLVSAYDIHHEYYGLDDIGFPEIVFLDSGGYEATKDHELSELRTPETENYKPCSWTLDLCKEVKNSWLHAKPHIPTAVVSYDHPDVRVSLREQIENANAFHDCSGAIREFLIKPEAVEQAVLPIDEIVKNISDITTFDIIGLTEKELGHTAIERMQNIARIRIAIQEIGEDTPIHIFGSLDTVLSPLYFISGADLFDGLTWLRYAYIDGNTSYIHHASPMVGVLDSSEELLHKTVVDNYYYLVGMKDEFAQFISTNGDFSSFKHHAEMFESSYNLLMTQIGE